MLFVLFHQLDHARANPNGIWTVRQSRGGDLVWLISALSFCRCGSVCSSFTVKTNFVFYWCTPLYSLSITLVRSQLLEHIPQGTTWLQDVRAGFCCLSAAYRLKQHNEHSLIHATPAPRCLLGPTTTQACLITQMFWLYIERVGLLPLFFLGLNCQ